MRAFSIFAGVFGCTTLWFAGCVGDEPLANSSSGDSGAASSSSSGASADAASGGSSSSSSGASEDGGDAALPAPTGEFVWEVHADRAGNAAELPRVSTALVQDEERIALATVANQAIAFENSSYPAGSGHMALALLNGNKSLRNLVGFGGGNGRIDPHAVAIDSAGNLYLVGSFQGTSFQLGALTLTNSNSDPEQPAGFYAKLSPTGVPLWAKEISGNGGLDSSCDAVAVRGTAVAVTCSHYGPANFELASGGGGANNREIRGSDDAGVPDRDILVMNVEPNAGFALWHKALRGEGGNERSGGLAFDGEGNLVVVGQLVSPALVIEHGLPSVAKVGSAGAQGFVLRFAATTPHAVNLSKAWGGGTSTAASVQPNALAVLPNHDLVLCGAAMNDPDLGRGNVATKGGSDAFVMRVGAGDATTTWVQVYGDAQNDSCQSLASTPEGDVVLGGTHRAGAIDIGGRALLPAVGSSAGHVARLASLDGSTQWTRSFVLDNVGTPTASTVGGVSVLPGGDIVVTGAWAGTMNLGAGSLQSTNGGLQAALYAVRLKR